MRDASNIITQSLSCETLKNYQAVYKVLEKFLKDLGVRNMFPVNPGHLVLFITKLFNTGHASSTIISKVSAIAYVHKIKGAEDPSQHFLVQKALAGVKKIRPSADTRQPLSYDLLVQAVQLMNKGFRSVYIASMYKAMLTLSFFACLRPGEITDSKNNLSVSQVWLNHEALGIRFVSFKHFHGRPFSIRIPRQGGPICPVNLVQQFLDLRGYKPGPLFAHSDLSAVSYHEWQKVFVELSARITGFVRITPHSPRIGGATHAAILGMSQEDIQRLGRWHSSAYQKYIRIESFTIQN